MIPPDQASGGFMRYGVLVCMAVVAASPAVAETMRVQTLRPASSDNAAALRAIQVEPFGGEAGDTLTIQVEDALREIDLGQGPYFRVIPAATGEGGDALLRGTADVEQRFTNYTEKRERCIRDAKGNCTDTKETVTVKCWRRQVDLVVQLRLIGPDGTLLWSDNRPEGFVENRCEDADTSPATRGAIVRELAGKVARRLRFDFAPSRGADDVRVNESRKGLSKADANQFKAAVRSVKERRFSEACASWAQLAAANPDHLPTRFNLGLCAESAGDEAAATGHYRHILGLDPRNGAAQSGLQRLASRDRARWQMQARTRQ